ncbi:MAG TPA: class I SAM-dependent methyltransferase [Acidimicrobiia bacterium]|nr:class I SAM-dependent methyltransferase [Acidimicrobiia bacterium]
MSEVAPDGSPVPVYLALPAGTTPALIDSAIAARRTILELGSGPGRITRGLVELGHRVTAVDDSPEMLAAYHSATETILADLFTLHLGRTFDVVLAASHLINSRDGQQRRDLLGVCGRHLALDGVVLIERYDPVWVADPKPSESRLGEVRIRFEPLEVGPGWFRGRVTYELAGRSWIQDFDAAQVTDEMLEEEAETAGLRLEGWLDEERSCARLGAGESAYGRY